MTVTSAGKTIAEESDELGELLAIALFYSDAAAEVVRNAPRRAIMVVANNAEVSTRANTRQIQK